MKILSNYSKLSKTLNKGILKKETEVLMSLELDSLPTLFLNQSIGLNILIIFNSSKSQSHLQKQRCVLHRITRNEMSSVEVASFIDQRSYCLLLQEKIKSSRYSSMNEFKRDILLCFSNCKTYNQPNSGIYMDANTLEVV